MEKVETGSSAVIFSGFISAVAKASVSGAGMAVASAYPMSPTISPSITRPCSIAAPPVASSAISRDRVCSGIICSGSGATVAGAAIARSDESRPGGLGSSGAISASVVWVKGATSSSTGGTGALPTGSAVAGATLLVIGGAVSSRATGSGTTSPSATNGAPLRHRDCPCGVRARKPTATRAVVMVNPPLVEIMFSISITP